MTGIFGFNCLERIKRKQDFKKVFDKGKRYSNLLLNMLFVKKDSAEKNPYCRIGIIASRKVGNAVKRNRLKRLIRESFRKKKHDLKVPCDIIVVLKPAAGKANGKIVQSAFLETCEKAHLF